MAKITLCCYKMENEIHSLTIATQSEGHSEMTPIRRGYTPAGRLKGVMPEISYRAVGAQLRWVPINRDYFLFTEVGPTGPTDLPP
ncbi:MAG: hypothetical protein A2474_01655 [Elusimicrobia bacterium RIFOXYC2_FULL_34_12]|nr:MAG: hypothetical protein A2474_01655 [Elusimicrobia bacterium RIFOXYC2_FULL_34_12]OGS39353.1 MAG: hypothetical protein A2551_02435 [Elusimicrobia bacterium RIFOXYD2_FULL_34_30]